VIFYNTSNQRYNSKKRYRSESIIDGLGDFTPSGLTFRSIIRIWGLHPLFADDALSGLRLDCNNFK